MGRVLALLGLLSGFAALPASAEASDWRITNRLSAGVVLDLPHHSRKIGAELLLSERFRARIHTDNGTLVEVVASGRTGLQIGSWTLNRTRIQELGVRVDTEGLHLEIGRHPVIDGGWRLVDGVQVLARPWTHLEVGGWLGLLPDPWTTAPAPRFGGGPILRWRGATWQAAVLAELAGTAAGLDRLAVRASGRLEIGRVLDLSARADLANGGPATPVRAEEIGVSAVIDPAPRLQVRAGWALSSGHVWLQGVERDPSLTRWWQRWTGAEPTEPVPWEETTDIATHLVRGSVVWTPMLASGPMLHLGLGAHAGLRPADPGRSTARIAAEAGVYGLLGGRIDVMGTGGALLWGGSWRSELGLRSWLAPDPKGALQIEAGARLWLGRRPDGVLAPSVAADLYLDWRIARGLTVALGYRLDNDLDTDRWNTVHTALVRASWTLKLRKDAP